MIALCLVFSGIDEKKTNEICMYIRAASFWGLLLDIHPLFYIMYTLNKSQRQP